MPVRTLVLDHRREIGGVILKRFLGLPEYSPAILISAQLERNDNGRGDAIACASVSP